MLQCCSDVFVSEHLCHRLDVDFRLYKVGCCCLAEVMNLQSHSQGDRVAGRDISEMTETLRVRDLSWSQGLVSNFKVGALKLHPTKEHLCESA